MNAPLTAVHAEILGMRHDINDVLDRLDDADSVRGFLANWFKSLPDELVIKSDGADRILKHPGYRALSPLAKRVADWALCPFEEVRDVKEWATFDAAYEATKFFGDLASSTTSLDDAHEPCVNARTEAYGLMQSIDEDDHAEAMVREYEFRQMLNNQYL